MSERFEVDEWVGTVEEESAMVCGWVGRLGCVYSWCVCESKRVPMLCVLSGRGLIWEEVRGW